jgi:hypothetical protein
MEPIKKRQTSPTLLFLDSSRERKNGSGSKKMIISNAILDEA